MRNNFLNTAKNAIFGTKPTVLKNILFNEKQTVPLRPPAGQPSVIGSIVGHQTPLVPTNPVINKVKAAPVSFARNPQTPVVKNTAPKSIPMPRFSAPTPLSSSVVSRISNNTQPGIINNQVSPVKNQLKKVVLGTSIRPNIPTPTPTPQYNDLTPYEKITMDTFNKYQIPKAVAYGIAGGEAGRRNKFNIGAFDSNVNNARIQGDLANATTSAKMLSGQANPEFYSAGEKGRQAFKQAWNNRSDAAKMLALIKEAGFAGDPKTWKQRSASQGGAGLYYDSWDQFIKDTPAFKKWINR